MLTEFPSQMNGYAKTPAASSFIQDKGRR